MAAAAVIYKLQVAASSSPSWASFLRVFPSQQTPLVAPGSFNTKDTDYRLTASDGIFSGRICHHIDLTSPCEVILFQHDSASTKAGSITTRYPSVEDVERAANDLPDDHFLPGMIRLRLYLSDLLSFDPCTTPLPPTSNHLFWFYPSPNRLLLPQISSCFPASLYSNTLYFLKLFLASQ